MQVQMKLVAVTVLAVALQLWGAKMMQVDAASGKGCGQACARNEDCRGSLFCTEDGVCADDPHLAPSGDCDGGLATRDDNKDIASSKAHHKGCQPTSFLKGTKHSCNQDYGADCCEAGKLYPRFRCSPDVSERTLANLTVNDFEKGGDGGGAAACDGKYHSNSKKVVALSTGWFNGGRRCHKKIRIFKDDKSVEATVVDECDSFNGCDKVHDFQPPCNFDTVDASRAVWEALGISKDDPEFGYTNVHWTDA